jgi:hypothetical protein
MKIDLDQVAATAVEKAFPWDLVLTVNGQEHRVKPLAVADVMALADLRSEPARLTGLLASQFEEPGPVAGWSLELQVAALRAILAYWKQQTEKKTQAIGEAAEAAVAASR